MLHKSQEAWQSEHVAALPPRRNTLKRYRNEVKSANSIVGFGGRERLRGKNSQENRIQG